MIALMYRSRQDLTTQIFISLYEIRLNGYTISLMFNVGIIGCGHIAEQMAETLRDTEGVTLYAVASRDKAKAEAFGEKWNAEKCYGSYDDLLDDKNVNLVYIATITSLHKDHMIAALKAGKPVLCEKSFTVNRAEAEEVFALAKEKNLYVAEAIWTRYMPSRTLINSIIDSGTIGRVTSITANLGYTISKKPRIEHPEMGGGAMLDISVYPINFALMALKDGKIREIGGLCVKNALGADIRETMDAIAEDGVAISMFTDTETLSDRKGIIYGTEGRIEVDNVNNPLKIEVFTYKGRVVTKKEEHNLKHASTGFEYELLEAVKAIKEGRTESRSMPWQTTLDVLSLMDRYRALWNIRLGSECREGRLS